MILISPKEIATKLYQWHLQNPIDHPWKSTNNPYYIWLSEIIMQQTRIAQGTPYYLKFVNKYPQIEDLAAAEEDEVMSMWQGLGYYSRARNMRNTAKTIVSEYAGIFPDNYKEILQLKGVGPYTAAAIVSFAYNQPYAVVDGNVIRVITRLYGIESAIDEKQTLHQIQEIVNQAIKKSEPKIFNQAIMDFGAQYCTPTNSQCDSCIFTNQCIANQKGLVKSIPKAKRKIKIKKRYFHYFAIQQQGKIVFVKRQESDIWQGLYTMPMIEQDNDQELSIHEIKKNLKLTEKTHVNVTTYEDIKKQKLSHQEIIARFYYVAIQKKANFELSSKYVWIGKEDIDNIGKPRIIDLFLKENSITLFTKNQIKK